MLNIIVGAVQPHSRTATGTTTGQMVEVGETLQQAKHDLLHRSGQALATTRFPASGFHDGDWQTRSELSNFLVRPGGGNCRPLRLFSPPPLKNLIIEPHAKSAFVQRAEYSRRLRGCASGREERINTCAHHSRAFGCWLLPAGRSAPAAAAPIMPQRPAARLAPFAKALLTAPPTRPRVRCRARRAISPATFRATMRSLPLPRPATGSGQRAIASDESAGSTGPR